MERVVAQARVCPEQPIVELINFIIALAIVPPIIGDFYVVKFRDGGMIFIDTVILQPSITTM